MEPNSSGTGAVITANNWQVAVAARTPEGKNTTASAIGGTAYTTGFGIRYDTAASLMSGAMTIINVSGNIWVSTHNLVGSTTTNGYYGAGNKTLSDVLDRIRITTVNGTDTFDAGSINIMYE